MPIYSLRRGDITYNSLLPHVHIKPAMFESASPGRIRCFGAHF